MQAPSEEEIGDLYEMTNFNDYCKHLCYKMLVHGPDCEGAANTIKCNGRHRLLRVDQITFGQIGQGEQIRIEIVRIHSSILFFVRILAHRLNPSGPWKPYVPFPRNDFEETYADMQQAPTFHRKPKVGYFGVVLHDGRPQRVQILRHRNGEVKVRLIDLGIEDNFNLNDVKFLHGYYQRYPAEIQSLLLSGIEPNDNAKGFVQSFVPKLQQIMADDNSYHIECRAVLHLQPVLMVDDVMIVHENGASVSLKGELISNELAEVNTAGIEYMQKMCADYGNYSLIVSVFTVLGSAQNHPLCK